MWNFLFTILIASSLCAAQVPAGATLYLSHAGQGQQQGGHECSGDDYKMLETEIHNNKVPFTLVGNEADAAYDMKCVAPDDIAEMMRAVFSNQHLKFAKAIAISDNKTKHVVWTYTCAGGMEQDLTKCLAKHLKDAPKGAGEDIQAQYGDRGTPLHMAASVGELDVVEYLVGRGANVGARTSSGITPLHKAAEGGHLEVVQFLIAHGADVNVSDKGGVTPLHVVGGDGRLAVTKFLVEHRANVNARVKDGSTPLHVAAHEGHLDVVEFLVAHEAQVNARGEGGQTPLHLAAYSGQPLVAQFLVAHGADINDQNEGGQTALCLGALMDRQEASAAFIWATISRLYSDP